MNTFISIIIGFLILGAVFTMLEMWFSSHKSRRPFRPQWQLDLTYLVFASTIGKVMERGLLILFLVPLYLLIVGDIPDRETLLQGFGPIGRQPMWLQALEIIVLTDLIGYWTHRKLFHNRFQSFWRMHAVHHSSTDLDWLSSVRVHPLNDAVGILFRSLPLMLLGWSPASVAAVTPLLVLYAIFIHADLPWTFGPFRYVLASPVFHRWHHTHIQEGGMKNFAGFFPIWDLLFGTFYMPEGRYPSTFGVKEKVPTSFMGQLFYPFSK